MFSAGICFNLKCYTSMDSSLQIIGKFFLNFKFVFELMAEHRKIFKRIARREQLNIVQSAMCYISMDSSQRAHKL